MQKLWDKGYEPTAEIERFTVGRDREMDMYLAEADVLASLQTLEQGSSSSRKA